MAVDTRKIKGRVRLRFNNLDEMLAYAEKLVASGTRQLGNWSLGQNLQHLALTQIASIDGFSMQFPLPIRFLLKIVFKRWMLRNRFFPSGPSVRTPTLPDPIDDQTALENLRAATHRVQTEEERAPNPGFGVMSLAEWNLLYLRHAELHLSYCVPISNGQESGLPDEQT